MRYWPPGRAPLGNVADGMGGHAAGDVASRIVIDALAMLAEDLSPSDLMQGVRQALHRAHDQIRPRHWRGGSIRWARRW
jgi:serine/threonine protein phosphatase PrpC